MTQNAEMEKINGEIDNGFCLSLCSNVSIKLSPFIISAFLFCHQSKSWTNKSIAVVKSQILLKKGYFFTVEIKDFWGTAVSQKFTMFRNLSTYFSSMYQVNNGSGRVLV